MNQNIIVFGARRTGTSLLVEILGKTKSNNLTIVKDKYNFHQNEFKTLQPFYNESMYHDGINDNNSINYYSLNNKIIKMFRGLFETDIKHFSSFRKILITNRHWISQNRSNKNLMNIIAKVEIFDKNYLHKKYSKEEFMNDILFDDGIEYGFFYTGLIIDIFNRKYNNKLIVVDFEKLTEKTSDLETILNNHNLSIKESVNLIDNKITKYKTKNNREGLLEFKEGYFDYLDKLHSSLSTCVLKHELLNECMKWFKLIIENLDKREEKIYKKYNLILSKEIKEKVLKGELTTD